MTIVTVLPAYEFFLRPYIAPRLLFPEDVSGAAEARKLFATPQSPVPVTAEVQTPPSPTVDDVDAVPAAPSQPLLGEGVEQASQAATPVELEPEAPLPEVRAAFPIWAWWDFPDGQIPAAVEAAAASWRYRAHGDIELHLVNGSNLKHWLPDLPEEFARLSPSSDAVADLARAGLVARYGGLFVTSRVLLSGNTSSLRDTLVRPVEFVSYDDQNCQKGSFSPNFLAGIKGNRFSTRWYKEARRRLTLRCPLTEATGATSGQPASCQLPTGALREVARPELLAAIKEGAPKGTGPFARPSWSVFCFMSDRELRDERVAFKGPVVCGPNCFTRPLKDVVDVNRRVPRFLERLAYVLEVEDRHMQRLDSIGRELISRSVGQKARRLPLISSCPGQAIDMNAKAADRAESKPLVLIHIPRTGGTSIEDCGKDEVDDIDRWGSRNNNIHVKIFLGREHGKCWGQHVPPTMAPQLKDVYGAGETFCVVRHPADRLISEYGFMQSWTKKQNQHCDADTLNEKLVAWMLKVKGVNGSRPYPYSRDCHMIPQAAFVYGWDPVKQQVMPEVKSCKHIIRFESLTQDFNNLMQDKGFPYRLSRKKSMPSLADCSGLKKGALYPKTKELMWEVYRQDFELLGYNLDA